MTRKGKRPTTWYCTTCKRNRSKFEMRCRGCGAEQPKPVTGGDNGR